MLGVVMGEGGGGELVLVIEHEPGVAELQRRYLAREGFTVEVEPDPARAVTAVGRIRPDVVVLDLSALTGPAADLYRRVAEAAHPAPVVCVTDPSDEPGPSVPHRVERPFSPRLLVATVGEALRHGSGLAPPDQLRAGAVTLDPRTRTAEAAGEPVALTVTEFDLLEYLMANPGRVFTREQLLDAAWGPGASAGSRTIDVHIAQLRSKLGDASPIRTVRGVGYAADA